MPPIFVIDGAPGAGKSTLSVALMKSYEFGFHIEVDRVREFVVSGIAHPMEWTEETGRQFRLAEEAAVDLAIRYQDAGFAVAIDHCRRLEDWDDVLVPRLAGRHVVKLVLEAGLEINLRRNRERTNKDFDTEVLERVISDLVECLPASQRNRPDWRRIDNSGDGIEAAVEAVLVFAGKA